jgi:hypothetical protein
LKGQQVIIEGIPSGKNRLFEGYLTARGIVTHSGKVAVQILTGQQVPVTLKLTGTGSADVCIEIEGYPSSCNQNDTFSFSTCLYGNTPQSTVNGTCKMYVKGANAYGTFTFISSKPDTTIFYDINGPINVQNSSGYRICQTIAQERTTNINYFVKFTINKDSVISSGYISKDSLLSPNSIIVKFYSVYCSTPDTNNINISLSSCLNGYTPTTSLSGKIIMSSNGKTVSGFFSLNNIADDSTFGIFHFEKVVRLQDSICQTIVVNKLTGSQHFLNMIIVNSKITYSYLSRDTLLQSEAIAKFFSVECSTPPPSFTSVEAPLNGIGAYPDTIKFSATMAITIIDGKVVGVWQNISISKQFAGN